MRRLFERLFAWAGRKLYGHNWPPILILVVRDTSIVDALVEEPKVFH